LLFGGRTDEQIKIHGFRIEPGEIEAELCAMPGIAQAAVIPREDLPGDKRLVAYVVTSPGADAPGTTAMRDRLGQKLPHYMIPSAFVVLGALPLNPNGKLERKALPAPTVTLGARTLLQTPQAELLCGIVAQLLRIDRVGLADNFFDLGGDSLLAVQLSTQIRTRLGRHMPVHSVFETPVLGDLAAQIGVATDGTTAFGRILSLREQGTLPPLICLYPGTGLGWPYANLLSVLNSEQPVYVIQPDALGTNAALPQSFDELIGEAYDDLRAIAGPNGPCTLAGWSFGGVLAHCLGTQLQHEGRGIRGLWLFDSYPMPPDAVPDYSNTDALWRDVALGAGLVLPDDASGLNAAMIQAIAAAQGHIFGGFPLLQIDNLARLMANNTRLLPTAPLRRYAGNATLFTAALATEGMDRTGVSLALWRPYFAQQIKTVSVHAEHHTMMAHDAVTYMRRHLT
jgi:thioesterase domain-containing protein/acyl carrier protein